MTAAANSSYVWLTHGPLFVVRLRASSPETLRECIEQLARYHAAHAERLVFVIIVGVDSPPPDTATREVMKTVVDEVYTHVREARIVHPGEGLRLVMLRSVTTMLTLVAGIRGHALVADRSVRAMLDAVGQLPGVDADALERELLAAGMLAPDELE